MCFTCDLQIFNVKQVGYRKCRETSENALAELLFLLFIDEVDSSEEGEVEVKLPDSTNTHPPLRRADSEELLRQEFDKSKLENNFSCLNLFFFRQERLSKRLNNVCQLRFERYCKVKKNAVKWAKELCFEWSRRRIFYHWLDC